MSQSPLIVGYGLSQQLPTIFPSPIPGKRAPTTRDINYQLGQVWIYNSTAYMLVLVSAGVATWAQLEASSGAGQFSSLTVTPGPISLTGTMTINTTGSAVTSIGTGGMGVVNIGNVTGNTSVAGNITTTGGNINIVTSGAYLSLPGPVYIYSGAGAPANGLAVHVGDMYINTTAASATTRLYIATAASTWTNVTCAG